MKYTIEITIAGCSTNCGHCYVDGGFAKNMSLEDYKLCIEKLTPFLSLHSSNAAITLGNELFRHPHIKEILEYNLTNLKDSFSYSSYYVPTTGIALLAKKDKYELLELLRQCGATGFMLALHGDEATHNSIVQNPIAHKKLFETEEFVSRNGFDVLFNVMVSKKLLQNLENTLTRVHKTQKSARLTVPVFVPTERMRKYQSVRADVSDCLNIANTANEYGIDASRLLNHCRLHTEKAIFKGIQSKAFDCNKDIKSSPDWMFLNVTQNLDLYYGNAGAHTAYLGNIRSLSSKEIIDTVAKLPSNYDYTAYFSKDHFEAIETYIKAITPDNRVYASYSDCICSILDKSGIKSLLI